MEQLGTTMEIALEDFRPETADAPADELAAGWTLVGRATLTPSIPDSRLIHALVFERPDGTRVAAFLDKTTMQFRAWPVPTMTR